MNYINAFGEDIRESKQRVKKQDVTASITPGVADKNGEDAKLPDQLTVRGIIMVIISLD